MYLASPTMTKPLYQYKRQFAICESCFWCATIFQRLDASSSNDGDGLEQCPLCKNKSISLVPLAKDEGYSIALKGKRGLEIEFSKHSRWIYPSSSANLLRIIVYKKSHSNFAFMHFMGNNLLTQEESQHKGEIINLTEQVLDAKGLECDERISKLSEEKLKEYLKK